MSQRVENSGVLVWSSRAVGTGSPSRRVQNQGLIDIRKYALFPLWKGLDYLSNLQGCALNMFMVKLELGSSIHIRNTRIAHLE